jgi:hypothetical protein
MKLIHNTGADRVIDLMRPHLKRGSQLGLVSPSFSLFAFAELRDALAGLEKVQLILPPDDEGLEFLGGEGDRAARNRLQARWLAVQCAKWISDKVELRRALGPVPQGAAVMRDAQATPEQVVLGSFAFSTDGLGVTPGNPLSLIQASESADEASQLARWFDQQWTALRAQPDTRAALIQALQAMGEHRDPFTLYTLILHRLFRDSGDEMDEERIVKSATGIRNTVVWKKLFKFQRDGVVGAIDKLNRFGGCIIADSVGLG